MKEPQTNPERTTKRRLLWIILALLFIAGATMGYRKSISPDLGFHLQTARWILENKAIPSTDIFTYTVPGNTYIDLQWIYQLTLHGLLTALGAGSITILTIIMTLLFSGTLLWRSCRRDGNLSLSAIGILIFFFLGTFWEVRPHLFSWIWGSLILLVLEEHGRKNHRWLPALPLLMVLWVNSHSLYVLGLISIATYVFSDLINGLWTHRRICFDKKLMLWSIAALFACLLNPYHIKGLLFPVSQFFLIQGENGYKSALSGTAEFLSPFRWQEYFIEGKFVLLQPLLWWQVFTVLAVAGMAGARKKARLAEWILFAGFLYIFNQAHKNYGYFIMACFPVVAGGLSRLGASLKNRKPAVIPHLATIFVCIVLVVASGTGWLFEVGWQNSNRGTGFDETQLPLGACDFINKNGIQGRIINCWDDGGYIGWATGQKVFINSEGNTIGLDFYDEYIRSRTPDGFPGALQKWKPTVAIVRYDVTPYWLFHLYHIAADWRMVYEDEFNAVFLHRTVAPHLPALAPAVAGRDYPSFEPENVAQTIQQAIDNGPLSVTQWLKGSEAYPLKEIRRAGFYLQTGEVDACIGHCLSGLDQAHFTVPEVMLTLGHALNAQRQYALADRCYDAFLKADSNPVIAREIEAQRCSRR